MFPLLHVEYIYSIINLPPLPFGPTHFLLSLPYSYSDHICFSSHSIPVLPKRIPTCGFNELTLSHGPFLFLFFCFTTSLCFYVFLPIYSIQTPSLHTQGTCAIQHTYYFTSFPLLLFLLGPYFIYLCLLFYKTLFYKNLIQFHQVHIYSCTIQQEHALIKCV